MTEEAPQRGAFANMKFIPEYANTQKEFAIHFQALLDLAGDVSEESSRTLLSAIADDFPRNRLLAIEIRSCKEIYGLIKTALCRRGMHPSRRKQSNLYTLAYWFYEGKQLRDAVKRLTAYKNLTTTTPQASQELSESHSGSSHPKDDRDEVAPIHAMEHNGQALGHPDAPGLPLAPSPPTPATNLDSSSERRLNQLAEIVAQLTDGLARQAHINANHVGGE